MDTLAGSGRSNWCGTAESARPGSQTASSQQDESCRRRQGEVPILGVWETLTWRLPWVCWAVPLVIPRPLPPPVGLALQIQTFGGEGVPSAWRRLMKRLGVKRRRPQVRRLVRPAAYRNPSRWAWPRARPSTCPVTAILTMLKPLVNVCPDTRTRTHTHTHTHKHKHKQTNTQTKRVRMCTHTHTHTFTHAHTNSLSLSHTHTHTHTQVCTRTQPCTRVRKR
jgi:hypothetical protein